MLIKQSRIRNLSKFRGIEENTPIRIGIFEIEKYTDRPQEIGFSSKLHEGQTVLPKAIGPDIRPHLSKRILDLSYHDDLLNDWGIHHLHLGTEMNKNEKFIKRTGPLLFARLDESKVYFINVYSNGAWTKQEMISVFGKYLFVHSGPSYRLTNSTMKTQ